MQLHNYGFIFSANVQNLIVMVVISLNPTILFKNLNSLQLDLRHNEPPFKSLNCLLDICRKWGGGTFL